jgi:hypothetical protein
MMSERKTPARTAEAELPADEFDNAVVPWSLDDLDRSADLGALRSAWTASDDAGQ